MADRKAELERKKAKLAELRQEKMRREQEKVGHESVAVSSLANVDPDAILKEMGVQDLSPATSAASSPKRQVSAAPTQPNVDSQRAVPTASPKRAATQQRLGVSKVFQVSIAPADSITYEKETQTSLEMVLTNRDPKTWDYYTLTYDDSVQRMEEDEIVELGSAFPNMSGKRRGDSQKASANADSTTDAEGAEKAADSAAASVREMSEEERTELLRSENFLQFIDRETRIFERILCQNEETDVFVDYARVKSEGGADGAASAELLTTAFDFFNEPICRGRTVTSLDWSSVHPDLLLTSYASQSVGEADCSACVIWNLRFRRCAPEYVLTCPSGILSACFARTVPNLVAAGTYSGSVCVWDLRAARRSPVQRTPIGGAHGHTHPVFNVRVANAAGGSAQQLVSLSTDGRMCTWSLDMLSAPLEVLELGWQKGARSVSATAFGFIVDADASGGFLVGSEDGAVYAGGGAAAHRAAAAAAGGGRPSLHTAYEGHFGPVTALDCNQLFTPHLASTSSSPSGVHLAGFNSQLFVSSGFDSTVRLWSVHDLPSGSASASNKPLFTIDHAGGYVTDAQWSPTHPAAFATLDSCGRVELWNLTRDCELPVATAPMPGGALPPAPAPAQAGSAGALNLLAMSKLRWHYEGRYIAAGDASGHVTLYQVGNEIASPKADEFSRLARVLADMRSEAVGGAPPASASSRGREDTAAHSGSPAT